MEGETIDRKNANRYDKILKENMESVLPVIIKDVLEMDIISSEEIPDDLLYTKERKPDVLKKITDSHNNRFILHLEWQSQNDKEMVYRMAEYAVMLYRKYNLPVKQYVIFMGKHGITMSTNINEENLKFRYHILPLKTIDYKFFLQSDNPDVKVFSILGNFEKDGVDEAVKNIVAEVRSSAGGELALGKYFNQLRLLSYLRNDIVNIKLNEMVSVSSFFRWEKDSFYRKGKEDGRAEKVTETLRQVALKMKTEGCAVGLISSITGLDVSEITLLK